MTLIFMAPAIGCYCQVITSLVDQVSRDLDWWFFSDKTIVGLHGVLRPSSLAKMAFTQCLNFCFIIGPNILALCVIFGIFPMNDMTQKYSYFLGRSYTCIKLRDPYLVGTELLWISWKLSKFNKIIRSKLKMSKENWGKYMSNTLSIFFHVVIFYKKNYQFLTKFHFE